MAQRGACTATGVLPGTDPGRAGPNQLALNLSDAWRHSSGEGQAVAVIDTGVQPGPRLPNVEPGGDFVESTDGLTDCDGHGTLVAGLIAGQPGDDGFSGVAPAARLISIRQTSAKFSPRIPSGDPEVSRAASDVSSLARAVVRAADLGARVINISAITCVPANKNIDQTELGAALQYAAVEKDAVIIAAAGNNRGGLATGSACESQSADRPGPADDPRNGPGHVGVDSVVVAAVRAVGRIADRDRSSRRTSRWPGRGSASPRQGRTSSSVSNAPAAASPTALPNDQQELLPDQRHQLCGRLRIRRCGVGAQPVSRTERDAGGPHADRDRARRGAVAVQSGRRRQRRSGGRAHLAGVPVEADTPQSKQIAAPPPPAAENPRRASSRSPVPERSRWWCWPPPSSRTEERMWPHDDATHAGAVVHRPRRTGVSVVDDARSVDTRRRRRRSDGPVRVVAWGVSSPPWSRDGSASGGETAPVADARRHCHARRRCCGSNPNRRVSVHPWL